MRPRSGCPAARAIVATLTLITIAAMSVAAPATRGAPMKLSLGSGSELWLEGTSTIHDYESRTKELTLAMSRDSAAGDPSGTAQLVEVIRSSGVRGVDVEVPVKSLRSGKEGLDKNLWRTLKADAYPTIRFRLNRYTVAERPASADTIPIHAEGFLTVAGQERPVSLDAVAYRTEGGLALAGRHAMRMSEYGIRPPTMMLGTLRVDDRITVHYRLLLVAGGRGTDGSSKSVD